MPWYTLHMSRLRYKILKEVDKNERNNQAKNIRNTRLLMKILKKRGLKMISQKIIAFLILSFGAASLAIVIRASCMVIASFK